MKQGLCGQPYSRGSLASLALCCPYPLWASAALTGNKVGIAKGLGHHSFPPPWGPACFTAGSVHHNLPAPGSIWLVSQDSCEALDGTPHVRGSNETVRASRSLCVHSRAPAADPLRGRGSTAPSSHSGGQSIQHPCGQERCLLHKQEHQQAWPRVHGGRWMESRQILLQINTRVRFSPGTNTKAQPPSVDKPHVGWTGLGSVG